MNDTPTELQSSTSTGEKSGLPRRKGGRIIAFSVLPVVLLFAIAELLLAILGVETGKDVQGARKAFTREQLKIANEIDRENHKLGGRAQRIKGTIVYLYKPHTSKYYNVNSLGFRGEEVQPKRAGEYRIMVMGGSTVFGQRVADDATIPAYLQGFLQRAYPDRTITVFNLGIEAYVFQNEIALARLLEPELQPDLILFYHGANDLNHAYTNGYCRPKPFEAETETIFAKPVTIGGKVRKLLYQSRVLQVLRPPLRRILRSKDRRTDAELRQNAGAFVQGYLHDAREVMERYGGKSIDVLFAIQPTLFFKEVPTRIERKMARILATSAHGPGYHEFYENCAKRLVESDMVEDLTGGIGEYAQQVYWDTIHLNPKGNEIVAKRLAEIVINKELIVKAPNASE